MAVALTEPLTWHNSSIYKLRFDGSRFAAADFRPWQTRAWRSGHRMALPYGTLRERMSGRFQLTAARIYASIWTAFTLPYSTSAAWSPTRDALIVERGKYYGPPGSVGYLFLLAPGAGGLVWEHALAESMDWHKVYGASIDRIRWSAKQPIASPTVHTRKATSMKALPLPTATGYDLNSVSWIWRTKQENDGVPAHRLRRFFGGPPSGQWLALTDYGGIDTGNRRHVLILDTYTGEIIDVAGGDIHRTVTWSPDSEWIAFAYETGGEGELRWEKSPSCQNQTRWQRHAADC